MGTARKHDDLAAVRGKLEELAKAGRVDELLDIVVMLLEQVRADNTALQVKLHNALRSLYGRRSEKVPLEQLALLFDELGAQAPEAARDLVDAEQKQAEQTVEQPEGSPKPLRRRRGRSPLPDTLPREKRVVRVPDELRVCKSCGAEKECIGHIRSELLEFVPAYFKVVELCREKLVCKQCEEGLVTAPNEKPMERGRPGPGLLAHLLVSKGQDSQPLYRQSQMYARAGVTLSPSTLGEWHAFACEVLEPIARAVRYRVLASLVVGADDTGIRVLDRDHPKGVKLGHMWGYVGDDGLVFFDYTPTWEAKGPLSVLEHFEGWLQGDGYAGFKAALTQEGGEAIIPEERRLGCAMHIRRKFEQAADAGDARAAIALAYFRKLYEVERGCRADGVGPDERKARRDENSIPVLDELYAWIEQLHPTLVPGDKLHAATRYARNQEKVFRRCFDDGRFEIDNGEVERQLRRVALGRKNYLFAGSDEGARRLAIAYTVLASCHRCGVDPLAYATDVIDKVQNGWPLLRMAELLPDVWTRPASVPAAPGADAATASPNA